MKLDKRKIFILACILVIIIIAVIILISNLGKKTKLDGEGIPTKAYYQQSGKNVKVVLKKTSDRQYYWTATSEKSGCLKITDKTDLLRSVYIISSESESNLDAVVFNLVNKDDVNEVKYSVTLSFKVDDSGKVTVIEPTYTSYEAAIHGDIAGIKYDIFDEDGSYSVYIDDTANEWETEKSVDWLFVGNVGEDSGKTKILVALANESTEIIPIDVTATIYSEALLKKIVIILKVDEDRNISLSSAEVQDYQIPTVIDEEAKEEFTETNGDIKLPAAAEKIDYDGDAIDFIVNENKYSVRIFDAEAEEEDIFGNIDGVSAEEKSEKINGTDVNFYIFSDDGLIIASWKADNKIIALDAFDVDENTFKAILKEIV